MIDTRTAHLNCGALRRAAMLVAPCLAMMATPVRGQSVPTDFAKGIDVGTTGVGAIVRVVLPDDVYATVTRSDLADLRVFNGAGEAVPHALRHVPPPAVSDAEAVSVPVFPLYQVPTDRNLLTQVAIGPSGAVLSVRPAPEAQNVVVAYLVDASTVKTPLARLSLEWESAAGSTFLTRIDVEASDDLNRWRMVVPAAAVARLQYDQRELTQSDIDLPGVRARYLRLAWPKALAAVTLKAVRLRPQGVAAPPEIRWTTRTGVLAEPGGAVEYEAGGRLPVEHVDVEFADQTDLASVSIRARPDTSAEWRRVYSGVFYALAQSGERLRSAPARIAPAADRYWRVEADSEASSEANSATNSETSSAASSATRREASREGGWKADRLPRLKLGWYAHELVFLARGQGPYTLAYGSAVAVAAGAPLEALLAGLGTGAGDRITPGTVGPPRLLGGDRALTPAPRSVPWRQIALWSVLLAAVVGLAVMVLRASREMGSA